MLMKKEDELDSWAAKQASKQKKNKDLNPLYHTYGRHVHFHQKKPKDNYSSFISQRQLDTALPFSCSLAVRIFHVHVLFFYGLLFCFCVSFIFLVFVK